MNELLQLITDCKPAQDYKELKELFDFLVPHNPKIILEIGLYQCGLLKLWGKVLNPDLVIGIDDTMIATEAAKDLDGGIIVIAPVKSQDKATYEQVKEILDSKKIDLLFIDGDHHYQEVEQDFEIYSSLLADKALVIFHDIAVADYDFCQVQSFWNDFKGNYSHKEIKYSVGTGIVFWES